MANQPLYTTVATAIGEMDPQATNAASPLFPKHSHACEMLYTCLWPRQTRFGIK